MTVYDSFHSLLDYECLLFHCDEWRMKNHCSHIELSERRLSDESPLPMNCNYFTTCRRFGEKALLRTVSYYAVCCHGNLCLATSYLATTRSLVFVAVGTWFPNHCSAMDYSVTILSILIQSTRYTERKLFYRELTHNLREYNMLTLDNTLAIVNGNSLTRMRHLILRKFLYATLFRFDLGSRRIFVGLRVYIKGLRQTIFGDLYFV
jgi:hypothetical protein